MGRPTTVKSTASRIVDHESELPCGSASISNTRRPRRARSAARCIEIVVSRRRLFGLEHHRSIRTSSLPQLRGCDHTNTKLACGAIHYLWHEFMIDAKFKKASKIKSGRLDSSERPLRTHDCCRVRQSAIFRTSPDKRLTASHPKSP